MWSEKKQCQKRIEDDRNPSAYGWHLFSDIEDCLLVKCFVFPLLTCREHRQKRSRIPWIGETIFVVIYSYLLLNTLTQYLDSILIWNRIELEIDYFEKIFYMRGELSITRKN